MDITLTPGKLSGKLQIVPSKSHAHRLMIGAALAFYCANHEDYNTNFRNGQFIKKDLKNILSTIMGDANETSEDLKATAECLNELLADNSHPKLFCGESGSTLRFLLPLAAALGKMAVFYGKGRLPERPLSPLDAEMARHGTKLIFAHEKAGVEREICRLSFDDGKMASGDYKLPGDVSSQFVTGLLFSLPLLDGDSTLKVTSPLQSAPYVDMTLDVLDEFGIKVLVKGTEQLPIYHIPGNQKYYLKDNFSSNSSELIGIPKPEGDWSAAAFWLVANALGSDIAVEGLNDNSLQGDRAIVDIINRYKAVSGNASENDSIKIDASQIPDLVPIVSVLAALSPARTVITGAGRLRIKESDRIKTTVDMLTALGADAIENEDGLTITGKELLNGGSVDGAGDHRIVMSAAIAATCCKAPVTIIGAEAAAKSYPNFFEHYSLLSCS